MSTATIKTDSRTSEVACAHCGLPARRFRQTPDQPVASRSGEAGESDRDDQGGDLNATVPAFCCRGCQGAYELIRGWGLEEFYDLRDAPAEEIPGEQSKSFEDLDDPRLLGKSAPLAMDSASGKTLLKSTLAITGMHCAACVWLIERAPERVSGWHSSHLSMQARTIDVVFDPTSIRLSEIAKFLYRLGYQVSPLSDQDVDAAEFDEGRGLLIDVAVAGFCAANAMWIAVALYAGQFTGIDPAHALFLRWAGVGLGCAAVIFPGRVFFRSALASIRTRTPHMDLPVAVGLSAGLAASLYALFDPTRDVYFDSIAALVFFLLTGRWLQMRQQRRSGEAVAALIRMSPAIANRIDDEGELTRVPVSDLSIGDRVWVRPSESIPVDGVVIAGSSMVDRSLLTGESFPVRVSEGIAVEAGTDNTQSNLTIRVTALGEETRLAAMQRSVAEASESRTPIVQLANRIGAWFVVVVLGLALVTGLVWWSIEPVRAISNVVALLIVACPCALALATPLAIAVAIGRLSQRDVLVRSGECLERIACQGTVFFDKTGTLTEGRMRVVEWVGFQDVLRDIASIESQVNHPIARAVVEYADSISDPSHAPAEPACDDVQHDTGRGVCGTVDGHRYQVGSLRLLDDPHLTSDPLLRNQLEAIIASGASPIVVIRDGTLVAGFGIKDHLRHDAVDVVSTLQARGWQVGILSGDHASTVTHVANSLEVQAASACGDLLPEDKLAAIRAASPDGPVLMVGDGVNDAAALAAADVGIAIRGGANASLAAAPVVIGSGRLQGVLDLIDVASQTRRTIRRNFAISIGYNVIAVTLAMAGWITPLIAAALMPISSLTVLGLTLASPVARQASSPNTTSDSSGDDR